MNAIQLKNVSFRYPNGHLANENLNLTIGAGQRVAVIGQNGAGKTTAVKLMNGLNKPTEGDVIVNGINTKDRTTAQVSSLVSYVFQNPDDQIFKSTVKDEIEFWCKYNRLSEEETEKRVSRAVELTEIGRYFENNPYEIPYSTKKFVSIASVLVAETPYMILDEPTAGQDMAGVECLVKIMDRMQEEGRCVVTITHDMEFAAKNFNRIIVMAHGNILLDGTPDVVFANDRVLLEARVKKPQICELACRLGRGNILSLRELVERL